MRGRRPRGRGGRPLRPVCEVSGAGVADRVFAIGGLEEDIDEGAALVVLLLKPVVEDVEDREQALLGAGAALPGAGFDELPRPAQLALLEERENEIVFGGEVAVERRLGDGGATDHFFHANGTDAATREQLVGVVENPLSRARGRRLTGRESVRHAATILL